jgi:hypothetical protein
LPSPSAANDFWGKTYKRLTGEKEMTQKLSILTGCSAGGTESFVVVPFELVKIKYVPSLLIPNAWLTAIHLDFRIRRVLLPDLLMSCAI